MRFLHFREARKIELEPLTRNSTLLGKKHCFYILGSCIELASELERGSYITGLLADMGLYVTPYEDQHELSAASWNQVAGTPEYSLRIARAICIEDRNSPKIAPYRIGQAVMEELCEGASIYLPLQEEPIMFCNLMNSQMRQIPIKR